MTFIVRTRSSQFSDEPIPEGLTQAVCVDVMDLGMQPGMKGEEVHKLKFIFETAARDSKGQPMRVGSWPYTVSLGKKANLRKDLERWRGRVFTAEELAGFDIDSVIGAPAMLNIVHREKDGKTFSNIDGIFKDTNAAKYAPTGSYVRAERHAKAETPEIVDYDEGAGVPF